MKKCYLLRKNTKYLLVQMQLPFEALLLSFLLPSHKTESTKCDLMLLNPGIMRQ